MNDTGCYGCKHAEWYSDAEECRCEKLSTVVTEPAADCCYRDTRRRTMPQRNRDKLLQQSMYDLLCKINRGMLVGYECIMEVFVDEIDNSTVNVAKRCGDYSANCEKCIADYLNEYPF